MMWIDRNFWKDILEEITVSAAVGPDTTDAEMVFYIPFKSIEGDQSLRPLSYKNSGDYLALVESEGFVEIVGSLYKWPGAEPRILVPTYWWGNRWGK
ncbi:MAG: hypothetical protein HQK53_11430, partial [Oligoflexia bacterium]|nr:hypothetical protein [Oligoflexia bacterium]